MSYDAYVDVGVKPVDPVGRLTLSEHMGATVEYMVACEVSGAPDALYSGMPIACGLAEVSNIASINDADCSDVG